MATPPRRPGLEERVWTDQGLVRPDQEVSRPLTLPDSPPPVWATRMVVKWASRSMMWSERAVPTACQPLPSLRGRMRWTSVMPPCEGEAIVPPGVLDHMSQMNWSVDWKDGTTTS